MSGAGERGTGAYFGLYCALDEYSWQAGFYLKIALAAIALVFVLALVPRSTPAPQAKFNWLYGVLFAPALAALLVAVQQVREWGFADCGCSASSRPVWY